jgi:DNA-binding CsgD family transcriptional regulator
MADRDAKGRHRAAKGEDAGKAKLTELQAIAILGDSRTQAIIAKEYGISPMTVSDIKRRYSWNHLAHIPSVKSESDKHSGRQGKSQNLDEQNVKEKRTSTEKYGILAARYGISVPTACDIRKRKSWKHVE